MFSVSTADSFPPDLEFLFLVVKVKLEVFVMRKRIEKAKRKEPKTPVSDLYDCCWYEPSCDNLCCGGVCGCS